MNKSRTDKAIQLTQELLERYWKHDYKYALSLMSDNVTWIGCTQEQFIRGIEAVTNDLELVDKELQECHLSGQEFVLVHNSGQSCSVAGKYLVTTNADTEAFLQVMQRCLCVWEIEDNQLAIKGLHVSNPMGELELADGEMFPNYLGKQTYQYLMDNLSMERSNHKIMIPGSNNVSYFIYEDEIDGIEAKRHNILIHTRNDIIRGNISITEFLEKHPNMLVRVHRSFAVNPMHIVSMKGTTITLSSGKEVRIPVKKKTEVEKKIEAYLENQ